MKIAKLKKQIEKKEKMCPILAGSVLKLRGGAEMVEADNLDCSTLLGRKKRSHV